MKKRLISALIAFIILIPLVILGGVYFKIGVTLLSIISIYEIMKVKENIPKVIKLLSYLLMIFIVFIDINLIIKILVTFFTLYIPIIFCKKEDYNIEKCTYLSSFIILLGVTFYYITVIRDTDINVLIFLLLVTILTDTFAFIFGKLIGKHKLIERISPNKTIEGSFMGSLFGTIVPSIFYIYMIDPGANILLTVLMVFILTIISQLGDLVFSSVKRYYNVKDFSNIMPGHGGILDRFDSLIFVVIGYIIIVNLI